MLKNIEQVHTLKVHCMYYVKPILAEVQDVVIQYDGKAVSKPISFNIKQGDRIALKGSNGCGKSSLIKLLVGEELIYSGKLLKGSKLKISYVFPHERIKFHKIHSLLYTVCRVTYTS